MTLQPLALYLLLAPNQRVVKFVDKKTFLRIDFAISLYHFVLCINYNHYKIVDIFVSNLFIHVYYHNK